MPSLVVSCEHVGQRLDRVLAALVPDMGLRGRRRLCALGMVLVNGQAAVEAKKLRLDDVVELLPTPEHLEQGETSLPAELVACGEHFAALYKPAGLHTEALAGKPDASVQNLLPKLLGESYPDVRLVNRLDFPTSGLVVAALSRPSASAWELAQRQGQTEKRYLALLEGGLPCPRWARNNLGLKGRQRVLAALEDHPDRRRHTLLEPLAVLDAEAIHTFLQAWTDEPWHMAGLGVRQVTLAGCTILKGARHQIRAHASAQGFPLLGDGRYGATWTALPPEGALCCDDIQPERERFFLHHGRIKVPEFSASYLPPWLSLLGDEAECAAKDWLHK